MCAWQTSIEASNMANRINKTGWLLLPVFVVICYAVAYSGSLFSPGDWYQGLNRAPWSPPNIAFPIVWTILYFFIALSGWIIFRTNDILLKVLWIVQLLLNGVWSWIFFGQHWVLFGLIDLILLLITVGYLCYLCWSKALKVAAFLLLPYFIWLGIATSLNTFILFAN